jgi:hypothetical protein
MKAQLKRKITKKLPKRFDILDIAGKYKPKKNANKSPEEARKYMQTHYKRI